MTVQLLSPNVPALGIVPEHPLSRVHRRGGQPLMLGWPVLLSCHARTHNTLNAARKKSPHKTVCICPRAQELLQDFRARQNGARNARRGGAPQPRGRRGVDGFLDINTAGFLQRTRSGTDMPECRIKSLGGPLPDEQADDFHVDDLSVPSRFARERAKATCRRCPLQEECLTAAVERREAWGVWGGLEPGERRRPDLVTLELRAIAEGARA